MKGVENHRHDPLKPSIKRKLQRYAAGQRRRETYRRMAEERGTNEYLTA